jgi:hypothetical protein
MVDRGLIIAQAEYHSSQVVSHGNAHFINPVVVHVPDHFLSGFILLLLYFLHLWTMVILQIFSWHLLLLVWLISWLSFFWVHLLRILLIIGHQVGSGVATGAGSTSISSSESPSWKSWYGSCRAYWWPAPT